MAALGLRRQKTEADIICFITPDISKADRDKLNVEELNVYKSNKDVGGLIKFMVNDIEMDELRVQKAVKK